MPEGEDAQSGLGRDHDPSGLTWGSAEPGIGWWSASTPWSLLPVSQIFNPFIVHLFVIPRLLICLILVFLLKWALVTNVFSASFGPSIPIYCLSSCSYLNSQRWAIQTPPLLLLLVQLFRKTKWKSENASWQRCGRNSCGTGKWRALKLFQVTNLPPDYPWNTCQKETGLCTIFPFICFSFQRKTCYKGREEATECFYTSSVDIQQTKTTGCPTEHTLCISIQEPGLRGEQWCTFPLIDSAYLQPPWSASGSFPSTNENDPKLNQG